MNNLQVPPFCGTQIRSLAECESERNAASEDESPQDRAVRLILASGSDTETMVKFAYLMGRFESAALNFNDVLENVRERR